MARLRVGCAVAALLAALLVEGSSAAPPAPAEPTLGPLISGTSGYVDGTFVWTDYAYDDHGPSRTATYAGPHHQGNAADLVQLQLGSAPRGGLRVTAVLETLTRAELPLLGVGLDLDTDDATGAASLPGSWQSSTPLGMEELLVLSSAGGEVRRWSGGTWTTVQRFEVTVDEVRNVVTRRRARRRRG